MNHRARLVALALPVALLLGAAWALRDGPGRAVVRPPVAPPTSSAPVKPSPAPAPPPSELPPPAVAPAPMAAGATVHGRVLEAATGRGVAGAAVVVTLLDPATPPAATTTDEEGRFELALPAALIARHHEGVQGDLVARAPGLSAAGVPLSSIVRGPGSESAVDAATRGSVRLELGPGLALRGQVTDLAGAPVPGARVRGRTGASVRLTWDTQTDARGEFVLDGVPPGAAEQASHVFNLVLPGMTLGPAFAAVHLDVEADGHARGVVPAAAAGWEPTVVRLPRWSRLQGRVLGADGGPVPGAVLAFSHALSGVVGTYGFRRTNFDPGRPPDGLTAAVATGDGTFELRASDGPGWLIARAPGHVDGLVAVWPPARVDVRLAAEAAGISVRVRGARGDPLAGTVYARVPGAHAPVAPPLDLSSGAAQVVELTAIPGAVADAAYVLEEGAVTLRHLPAIELEVWHGHALPVSRPARPGAEVDLVRRTGGVLVTVGTELADAVATAVVQVDGALLETFEPPGSGHPQELELLAPADVVIAAFAPGHAPQVRRLRVEPGASELVELSLRAGPGGALRGEVVHPPRPVELIEVRWLDPVIGVERLLRLPGVATWSAGGIGPGQTEVRVRVRERLGGELRTRDLPPLRVDVREGEPTPLTVDLR